MKKAPLRASYLLPDCVLSMSSNLCPRLALNSMKLNKQRKNLHKHRPSSTSAVEQQQHQGDAIRLGNHLFKNRLTTATPSRELTSATRAGAYQNKLVVRLVGVVAATLLSIHLSHQLTNAYKSGSTSGRGSGGGGERMVRLCIASVDPTRLTSQCVMCNRREFPLTVIDCTGITKVNDLIANPLSVVEAGCLIANCKRQVPDVEPEPYHGSVSHAVNYRGAAASAASNYHPSGMGGGGGGPVSGSNLYEMVTPSGIFGGGYPMYPSSMQSQQSPVSSSSPYMTRFGSGYGPPNPYQAGYASPYSSSVPRGMIGGPSIGSDRQPALPYALVPAPRTFPFGSRKYKAALVPLFR